jgi:hypothetical protein
MPKKTNRITVTEDEYIIIQWIRTRLKGLIDTNGVLSFLAKLDKLDKLTLEEIHPEQIIQEPGQDTDICTCGNLRKYHPDGGKCVILGCACKKFQISIEALKARDELRTKVNDVMGKLTNLNK